MNPNNPVTFEGNNTDLMAVAGVIITGTIVLSCVPGGSCLWWLLPLILGIIGLISADQSVDPDRTRKFSWISIGVSGLLLLLMIALISAYFLFVFVLIAIDA